MLSPTARELAKREIDDSLIYCTNIMNCFGLSFEKAKDNITFIKQTVIFTLFVILAITHFTSEFIYIVVTAMNSPRIEDVVPLLHTVVYTIISSSRLSVIWYKKNVFGRLLRELVDIWPVPPLTDEAQLIKRRSLFLLRLAHQWYFALSVICDIFFNSTPIGIYFYEVWQGHENPKVGFVWVCWYPFDKYRLIPHILVYLFEMFSGLTSLLAMLSADLLFTAIASHICLLLRILHQRLRAIGSEMQSQDVLYKEVIECVKLHQRLITYCNEMEETFSVVNLINVMLSSVAICCVVFVVVLLDPPFEISNKLFAITFIIQTGLVCWYSDDIFRANEDVAIAAYESLWYNADPQCRRALLLLIIRAQKPIGFTAMKFAALNLTTYSAILMRSYSYFTLLYTMFKK